MKITVACIPVMLHAMAAQIGLRRSWFQTGWGRSSHYDLTLKRREAALKAGAIELDRHATVEKIRALREIALADVRRQAGAR